MGIAALKKFKFGKAKFLVKTKIITFLSGSWKLKEKTGARNIFWAYHVSQERESRIGDRVLLSFMISFLKRIVLVVTKLGFKASLLQGNKTVIACFVATRNEILSRLVSLNPL